MRRLDLVRSLPHYEAHLRPIWEALGSPGAVTTPSQAGWTSLVGSFADAQATRARKIYVEHGAGQTYAGVPDWARSYYSGGPGHARTIGFVCPNETVADRWRAAYPDVPARAVGCPKLDRYVGVPTVGPPTIAITSHWDCRICPETLPALPGYEKALNVALDGWVADGFDVIMHEHPKGDGANRRMAERLGLEFVADEREVFARADVLIADNTSLLMEFVALGRPVVFLDAPWYETEHGGRFWEWTAAGELVKSGDELLDLDMHWVFDHPEARRAEREGITERVYGTMDGRASERAAAFVRELMEI